MDEQGNSLGLEEISAFCLAFHAHSLITGQSTLIGYFVYKLHFFMWLAYGKLAVNTFKDTC